MHVFKYFFCLLKKNLGMAIMYLGIFLVIFFLVSGQAKSQVEEFTDKKIQYTVIDNDQTSLSQGIVDFMNQKHTYVEQEDDKNTLSDALYYGDIKMLITIPKGFTEDFLDSSNEISLSYVNRPGENNFFVVSQIERYLSMVKVYCDNGSSLDEALDQAAEKQKIETKVTMFEEQSKEGNKFQYFFQYLPYMYISIIVNVLGMILILFRKEDLRKRNICGALSYKKQQLQIGCASFVMALVVWLFMVVVFLITGGAGAFDSSMLYAQLNSFVFVMVSVSITYMISQLVSKLQVLSMIANVLGLGMSFLCGVFVPQQYLGAGVLMVGKFLPAYWYVRLNNVLFHATNTGNALTTDVFICIGIQVLFVIACFVIGMVAGRRKKES